MESECGKIQSLAFFFLNFSEALNDAFEVVFSRASFLHLIKDTDSRDANLL